MGSRRVSSGILRRTTTKSLACDALGTVAFMIRLQDLPIPFAETQHPGLSPSYCVGCYTNL